MLQNHNDETTYLQFFEIDLAQHVKTFDVQGLRALLDQTETSQRSAEKEKSLLITQLTEQNQRLTSQLKDVSTRVFVSR